MTNAAATIAKDLLAHATKNYEKDGWDNIVECNSVEELTETIIENEFTTLDEAIAFFGRIASILDSRRADIRSERF